MSLLEENGFFLVNLNDSLQPGILPECKVKESWNNLQPDSYLKHAAKYRERRYSRCIMNLTACELDFESSIYIQTEEYNSLFGGVSRTFAAVELDHVFHDFIKPLTFYVRAVFANRGLLGPKDLSVGIHQIRTIATTHTIGQVTPEGLHKDGHKLFAIHLIDRKNIIGGNTKIYDNEFQLRSTMTLESYLDSLFVQDSRIYHEVTPIAVEHPYEHGHRDVLIIEFY